MVRSNKSSKEAKPLELSESVGGIDCRKYGGQSPWGLGAEV